MSIRVNETTEYYISSVYNSPDRYIDVRGITLRLFLTTQPLKKHVFSRSVCLTLHSTYVAAHGNKNEVLSKGGDNYPEILLVRIH